MVCTDYNPKLPLNDGCIEPNMAYLLGPSVVGDGHKPNSRGLGAHSKDSLLQGG